MDRATATARNSIASKKDKEWVLRRLEEKELRVRCLAVNMCHRCGQDLRDTSAPSSHWTELACPNKKCKEHGVVVKSYN